MPNPELLIVISAQDAASNVVKGVEKALQDFRAQNKAEAAERKAIRDKETAEYKASSEYKHKMARMEIFDMQMMASNMQSMGMSMTVMGAAGIAAFTGVAKAAIDWETAFTGVRKTVEMTDTEASGLKDTLRGMALRIPVDTTGLAKIAEIAGQLGIKGKANIEKFTETIARMEVATNMTAEQASTNMARIATVMGMPIQNVDRMGAAIVDLGNKSNATESEISAMAQRISGAGKVVGMSVPDVLGMATALSSVGIEAEMGGSAISRAMIEIANSVALGDEKLQLFAAVAGMTAEQFAAQWKTAPAQALAAFIDGLGGVKDMGGNVFKVIDDLGLGEIRLRDATLRLSGAQGILSESLQTSKAAWDSNSALIEESERRFKTLQSQITLAMNAFKDIAITLGESVTPQMQGATAALKNIALATGSFAKEHPTLASAATLMVGLGSATTLAGGIFLIFASRVLQAYASLTQFALMASGLPLAFQLVARGITAATGALFGPAGLVAGLALGAHWVASLANESRLATKPLADLTLETEAYADALQRMALLSPEVASMGEGLRLSYSQAGEAAQGARLWTDYQNDLIRAIIETDSSLASMNEQMKGMSREQLEAILSGAKVQLRLKPPSLPKPPTLPDLGGEDAAGAAKKLEDALAGARKQIASIAGDLGSLVKGMNELTNVQDLTALSLEELTSLQSQAQATVGTSYEGAQIAVDRAREAILNYNALVSSGTATVDSLAAAEDAVRFAVDNARFSTQLYSDELKGLGDITDEVKRKTKELAEIAAKEAAEAAEKAAEAIRLWNEQLERNNNLQAQINARQLGGLGEQRATQTQMITDSGKKLLATLRETGLTGEALRARMEGYGFTQERVNEIMGVTSEKAQGMIDWVRSLNLGLDDEKRLLESMLPAYFGLTRAQEEYTQKVRDYQFELQKAADLQRTVYGPAAAAAEMGQAQFAYASIMQAIGRGVSPREAVAQFRKDQPLLGKAVDIITTGPGLETHPGFTGPRPRLPGYYEQGNITETPSFKSGGYTNWPQSETRLASLHGREAVIPGDKLDAMIALLAEIAGKPVIDGPGFAQSVSAYMQSRSSSLSRMGA